MCAQAIFPTLRYDDAQTAIDFLERAFGLERRSITEEVGIVHHAELAYGDSVVMVGSNQTEGPLDFPPPGSGAVYVLVDDVDAHHERAVTEGAEIVMELTDQDYGSREYAARDPEGHTWNFGTYRPK